MAKRKRLEEGVKWLIANRLHGGEEPDALASEYDIAVSTVKDYGKKFPQKRKVKRKVMTEKPKENTRVSPYEAENQGLREENQRLRNLLLDEILRNR